jgi:hypothetical protein
MKEIQWQVEESSKKAQEIMKAKYNSHKRPITYEEGQKVWLDISNFTSEQPSKKLDHKHYGPFDILEKCGSSSYCLKLPKTWKIFPIFNEALLTPYTHHLFLVNNQNTTDLLRKSSIMTRSMRLKRS